MKVEYGDAVIEALGGRSGCGEKSLFKQVRMLEQNLRHPSLRAKKYDEANDLWQARVNRDWRFYFRIVDDTCRILKLIPHPK